MAKIVVTGIFDFVEAVTDGEGVGTADAGVGLGTDVLGRGVGLGLLVFAAALALDWDSKRNGSWLKASMVDEPLLAARFGAMRATLIMPSVLSGLGGGLASSRLVVLGLMVTVWSTVVGTVIVDKIVEYILVV